MNGQRLSPTIVEAVLEVAETIYDLLEAPESDLSEIVSKAKPLAAKRFLKWLEIMRKHYPTMVDQAESFVVVTPPARETTPCSETSSAVKAPATPPREPPAAEPLVSERSKETPSIAVLQATPPRREPPAAEPWTPATANTVESEEALHVRKRLAPAVSALVAAMLYSRRVTTTDDDEAEAFIDDVCLKSQSLGEEAARTSGAHVEVAVDMAFQSDAPEAAIFVLASLLKRFPDVHDLAARARKTVPRCLDIFKLRTDHQRHADARCLQSIFEMPLWQITGIDATTWLSHIQDIQLFFLRKGGGEGEEDEEEDEEEEEGESSDCEEGQIITKAAPSSSSKKKKEEERCGKRSRSAESESPKRPDSSPSCSPARTKKERPDRPEFYTGTIAMVCEGPQLSGFVLHDDAGDFASPAMRTINWQRQHYKVGTRVAYKPSNDSQSKYTYAVVHRDLDHNDTEHMSNDIPPGPRYLGTLMNVNKAKSFGFLRKTRNLRAWPGRDRGLVRDGLYFHFTQLAQVAIDLRDGLQVEFSYNPQGRGYATFITSSRTTT